MSTPRLLDPTLDLNFKRVFADSPELLMALINAVRWDCSPVVELEILNPQIVPEDISKKMIMLDLLARDDTGRMLNIEMQTRHHPGLPARLVFYLARLLAHQLDAGEEYRRVQPVVGIALLDFDLFQADEQALWRFELRDAQRPQITLDRSLSLHVIELPKAEQLARAVNPAASQIPGALAQWVMWFRHWNEESVMQQIQHPAVKKAHQRLHAASGDDQAWIQALHRERALMLEAALKAQAEEEKAEAEARGRTAILRHLLQAKFGNLTPNVEYQLQHADTAQLMTWGERILSADTLEQVFSHH